MTTAVTMYLKPLAVQVFHLTGVEEWKDWPSWVQLSWSSVYGMEAPAPAALTELRLNLGGYEEVLPRGYYLIMYENGVREVLNPVDFALRVDWVQATGQVPVPVPPPAPAPSGDVLPANWVPPKKPWSPQDHARRYSDGHSDMIFRTVPSDGKLYSCPDWDWDRVSKLP